MSAPSEQSEVIRIAVAALDRMGIAYAVGGSMRVLHMGRRASRRMPTLPSNRLPAKKLNSQRSLTLISI
jgi:hypothetical protein